MTGRPRVLGLLHLLTLALALAAPALAQAPSLPDRLDAIASSFVQPDGPGMAVVVVQDGSTLLRKGYGMADLERSVPVAPETVFRIGSITKQFTAVAVLQLVAAGKVGLDDPLAKYLPDFPGADKVTVRHLLTHTSGIKSYTSLPSFMQRVREDMTPAAILDLVKNEPVDFAPGERMLYNNSGYVLLGVIIEKASGLPYGEYMEKRVFAPLGLAHTIIGDETRVVPRRAQGYGRGPDGVVRHAPYMSMTQPYAAGIIESTVDDLARWNAALLSGQAMDRELLEQAWTSYRTADGQPTGYGFGWQLSEDEGLRFVEHGGGILGFVSHGVLVPERKLFVAVLHNGMGTDVDPEWVANLLALEALGRSWNTTPVALSRQELERFPGVYDFAGVKRTITLEDGKLFAQREGSPKFALVPVGKDELAYERAFSRWKLALGETGAVESVTFTSRGQPAQQGRRLADAPPPRPELALDPAVLDRYVGVYELQPGFRLTVTREGAQLMVQATGQPNFPVYAESETRFFYKVVDAALVFTAREGSDGKAGSVTLHQGGREMPAKRVD